jgi:hypothetical protein
MCVGSEPMSMIPASYAINPDFFVYTFDPTHICILKILMLQRIPDLEEVMPVLGPTSVPPHPSPWPYRSHPVRHASFG